MKIINFLKSINKLILIGGATLLVISLIGIVYYIKYGNCDGDYASSQEANLKNKLDGAQKAALNTTCSMNGSAQKKPVVPQKTLHAEKKSQSSDSIKHDSQSDSENAYVDDSSAKDGASRGDSGLSEPTIDDDLLDQLAAEQLMRELARDNEKNDCQQSDKANDKTSADSKQPKELKQPSSDANNNGSSGVAYRGNDGHSDAHQNQPLRNELDQGTDFAKQRFMSEQARQALEEAKAEVTRKIKDQIVGSV